MASVRLEMARFAVGIASTNVVPARPEGLAMGGQRRRSTLSQVQISDAFRHGWCIQAK
jgi:hypothetical protein